MRCIGEVQPWLNRLELSTDYTSEDVQETINEYASRSGISVVGGFIPSERALELMLWPETRPDYVQQSIEKCERSAVDLAKLLGTTSIRNTIPQPGMIHCMMGLKVGGYDDGRIADLSELDAYRDKLTMTPAHMVSARKLHDGTCESYGEPTVIVTGASEVKKYIDEIGDKLEQYHYAIESADRTRFYETEWARVS